MRQLLIALGAAMLLSQCGTKNENEKLSLAIDSLKQEVAAREYTIGLLETVGQYMDSIDANRKWISISLETGISEEDYIERMKLLNRYVQKAEWTIGELEKTRSAYESQVKRLKGEIGGKNNEIKQLQLSVNQYKEESGKYKKMLSMSKEDLYQTQLSLEMAEDELALASLEIDNLIAKVKLTEAEVFFAQAEGMEEVAGKILFAPRKKKRNLEGALDAYTTAYEMGYAQAEDRVESLKKKLKKD